MFRLDYLSQSNLTITSDDGGGRRRDGGGSHDRNDQSDRSHDGSRQMPMHFVNQSELKANENTVTTAMLVINAFLSLVKDIIVNN